MATPDTAIKLSIPAQDALVLQCNSWISNQNLGWDLRGQLLEKDRVYQREMDLTEEQTRARLANKSGDAAKIQNVTIPVVLPQVEAAHSYLVETFLTSYPIFPVVSKPEYEDIAQQVEAVMGEASVTYQYTRQFSMAFRDVLKYNLMAMEVDWKTLKTWSIANQPSKDMLVGSPVEVVYAGNMVKRLDLYNIILDTRVAPAEVHEKGDFAGYTELLSRVQLKQRFLELDPLNVMNENEAFKSGTAGASLVAGDSTGTYYIPVINVSNLRNPQFNGANWMNWAGLDTKEQVYGGGMFEVTTLYTRIIPREYGIHSKQSGVPHIYKLIIINQRVLVYAEQKSNVHNFLPIVVGQALEDGLNYQTKSFADNATPYQTIASALYNSGIISQRRKVYDRIVYDPDRIAKKDIDRVDPVARIPVKQAAYGKPIGESFAVMPYKDDGVPLILGVAREVTEMADIASGQNRVQRGQFQKGNKTRSEFNTVMDKSDARMRTMAVVMESSFLQPVKYIMKMNILQYQPPAELFNVKTQSLVKVQPGQLRTVAWQFQVADGVMPVDKLTGIDMLPQIMQAATGIPQLAAEWDLVGAYMYSLKLQGATWVDYFKRSPAQQQQVTTSAQQPPPSAA